MFHLTLDELAAYTRERLQAKLKGEKSSMPEKYKSLRCKYILDNGKCLNIDEFTCPFVAMWDIAKEVCKGYEVKPRKMFIIVNSDGDQFFGTSRYFDTEQEALNYIKTYIKVREFTYD